MKTKYYPWILAGALFLIVIFLNVMVSFLKTTQKEKTNTIQPTLTPTVYLTPTIFYSRAWQKSNSLSALKNTLIVPTQYQGITIEYRPKNDIFFIFHKVSQTQTQLIAASFFQRYGLNIQDLKITYLDLNPTSTTTLPPKGFFEGKE